MDFKSLINKIESIDGKIESVAAPELPKAVQLNEDAELRVLAGTSSYIAEAKKCSKMKEEDEKEEEVEEGFDSDAKVGDTFKTKTGTATKTKTGVKHERTYEKEKDEDDEDAPKSKKAKKESVDPTAFKEKFTKMVEAKKGSKPDFLDVDKDGDKKEPMKKAAKDKKDGSKAKDAFQGMFGGSAKDLTKNLKVKEAAETGDEYGWDVKEKPSAKSSTRKVAGKAYGGAAQKDDSEETTEKKTNGKKVAEASTGDYSAKKAAAGKDIGKPGKQFAKIAKSAGEKYGSKERGEKVAGAVLAKLRKESVQSSKKVVAESVEQKLTFKDMVKLVQESGGQQQIDPVDTALFNWAQRVAAAKFTESTKAELYAGLIYERNGGVFQMYDVLSEDQK